MSPPQARHEARATPRAVTLKVNGSDRVAHCDAQATLLHVLRNDFELNGPKYGCGLGECGACTVHVDGIAARACVIPAQGVAGREITTLEGLACEGAPNPVQQAFIAHEAAQCGYCLNGMVMQVAALLRRHPDPSEDEVRRELSHNLCRCGTHVEILRAALDAARRMKAAA